MVAARTVSSRQLRPGAGNPPGQRLGRVWLPALLIVLVTAAVYANSLSVTYLLDDGASICTNPNLRHLWPFWESMPGNPENTLSGRPVLRLTFAVGYALHGLDVRGYHAVNVAIHVLAALAMFGAVRRTLLGPVLARRFAPAATGLALAVALVWAVHPLLTESVTYIVQRAESLMGLMLLTTLYCAVRGFASPRAWAWNAAAAAACAAGMGCKEVMVVAPVLVLLHDRTFLSGSFAAALRRRWPLYAGLAATWAVLAAVMWTNPRSESAGLGFGAAVVWQYGKMQSRAIVEYLLLAVAPVRLCFDYGPLRAMPIQQVLPWAAGVAALVGATVWALWKRPVLGFLGAWFLVILAPSSSFIPVVTEAQAEHRAYLSLAAVVALVVVGGYALADTWLAQTIRPRGLRVLGTAVIAGVVGLLGAMAVHRNQIYNDPIRLWRGATEICPDNRRACNNLAWLLATGPDAAAHAGEAVALAERACRSNGDRSAELLDTLAAAYAAAGRFDQAIAVATRAIARAQEDKSPGLARDIQSHLELYRTGRPYVDRNLARIEGVTQ